MILRIYYILLFTCISFASYTSSEDLIVKNPPKDMYKLRVAFLDIEGDSEKALPVYYAFIKQRKETEVLKAYIGTLECILADQQGNPINKLSWFNKGKKKIESSILKYQKNPELRFLRLTVQKNAPSFLFYNSNIEEDKKIIIDNIDHFQKLGIKNKIVAFLKANFKLTNQDLTKIS